MKVLILLCSAAMALAGDHDKHDGYGHHAGHYGGYNYAHAANRHREANVNQYNAARQHAVNAAAEHYGAGTGTAKHYGVPGVNSGYAHGHGYGNHGFGYGGHGHGYGYGGYGYDGKY